jgi:F0F1-type ATP synthase delta subunit
VETANNKMFSRFLSERILTKELKPVLHIKVKDTEKQEECIQHLLNLMSKKWLNVTHDIFKLFFHRAIKVHQDN